MSATATLPGTMLTGLPSYGAAEPLAATAQAAARLLRRCRTSRCIATLTSVSVDRNNMDQEGPRHVVDEEPWS